MELYVIRHSIAHNLGEQGAFTDEARTLTPAGVERAVGVGRGLASLGIVPGLVLVSPAVRTRQTAEHIFGQMALPQGALVYSPAVGLGGSAEEILAQLGQATARHAQVAVVGHEPTMSDLISLLACSHGGLQVKVGRASVTRVDVNGSPRPGAGVLRWKLNGDHLAAIARGSNV